MTREEAIDLLDNLIGMIEDNHKSDYDTAFRMAIKALEQKPCNTDTCKVVKAYMNEWDKPNNSDAISRDAVLDAIEELKKIHFDRVVVLNKVRDRVLELQSVKQETNIKALGEELRMCQKSITDDKVLVGFNIAVAICNKYFAGSEVQE